MNNGFFKNFVGFDWLGIYNRVINKSNKGIVLGGLYGNGI